MRKVNLRMKNILKAINSIEKCQFWIKANIKKAMWMII